MSLPGVDHRSIFFTWMLMQFLLRGAWVGSLGLLVTNKHLTAAPSARHRLLESCCMVLWSLPLLLLVEGVWRLNHGLQRTMSTALPTQYTDLRAVSVLKEHDVLLLAIWGLGTVVLLARLLLGLRRLRATPTGQAPLSLEHWVTKNSHLMGMHTRIYSAAVTTPLVFGHWRPRLLVPFDMHSVLEEDEIEALLLHEFSHIRRHDYLRNMVQRIFVCIFWFHPFSWLLVRRLTKTRELCCDAEAVKTCAPVSLGRALLKLLEGGRTQRESAPGLSSLSGDLGDRLAALIHEPDTEGRRLAIRPFRFEPTVFALLFCSVGALTSPHPMQLSLLRLAQNPQTIVHAVDNAGEFELHIWNGRVLQAKIGSEVLTGDLIAQKGRAVSLLDHTGRPRLVLTVEPTGHIAWTSRMLR